ncbi:3'-5' exoribonuclease [Serratia sp. JUb9]|uniref:3'-5' exonuclease n=1 Tax=Serratia sp. JUb9 TaxID=2724469 RepID=UPI00164CE089|nr:3'-5' exonuclease [Serratia sp. JUb9]QNK34499.1 3'-5' exoribonuclease [Serratia sp. JUb9]
MHHVMLDIETLDVKPSAVILVVAAVFFDPKTGQLGEEFEAAVSPQKEQDGRTISLDTVAWWARQSDEARKLAFGGSDSLKRVLTNLSRFIHMHSSDTVKVWGNGKEFDCAILEHAFQQLTMPCPWKFWHTQDVRTLVTLAELRGFNPKKARPFEGTPHRALDDAKHQARYVADVVANCYFRHDAALLP